MKKKDALLYHSDGRPGKIQVVPTKPYSTQHDLSLAYSPGVAEPCLEIEKNPDDVYKYTAKGNLVAVISNGTAVLGLGDIGAAAGKPVMEGKGLLFKIFADIDVFDIELDTKDVDRFVDVVKAMAPTFGGINLEDIKAPECFEIESRLKAALDIPVMHDDQHGTAIISAASLLNALEINGKKIEEITIVVSGAGAAAVSCTRLYIALGANPENIVMLDSKGVIRADRENLSVTKKEFATKKDVYKLEDALKDADMFLGLSVANLLSIETVRTMASDPIIFALANPNPEISYENAMKARKDIIFATGRSDHPNQVNNVLGFPFIFRGALDVGAKAINEEMKIAAVKALANLAKKDVPETVNTAYKTNNLIFGRDYIIPKPLDPRLITTVAPAVAEAAIKSGVARRSIEDWDAYKQQLIKRLGLENELIRAITGKAKSRPMRVVFAEANNFKVLKAAQISLHEGIAKPVLLGNKRIINKLIEENKLDLSGAEIIELRSPAELERRERYAKTLFQKRQRQGLTYSEALEKMHNRNYFGIMMVETGEADAFVSGVQSKYEDCFNPALEIVGAKSDVVAGMYVLLTKRGPMFFADTTVNVKPSAEMLVKIARLTAEEVKRFNIEPVMAMVSFSNFGSVEAASPERVRTAVKILHEQHPDLLIDGEMQANIALNRKIRDKQFPFTKIHGKHVNTVIFPNGTSGSVAYKMLKEMCRAEAIGPILVGVNKPVHMLQMESSVRDIVNMVTLAVVDAQCLDKTK